jgi:hypothetical protein
LQAAKLHFRRSNEALGAPRYWAAFVLNGDGWAPTARVIPWTAVLLAFAVMIVGAGVAFQLASNLKAAKREPRTAPPSR